MYQVDVIANEILKMAKRKGMSPLTPMQLVKLAYIAYGFSLAILDKRIFADRIEAWKYGPVIPNLYQSTKHFGRDPIPHDLINDQEESEVDDDTKEILEGVVSHYGILSGIRLSNLTHQTGTPWRQVYCPDVMNLEIPDDLIRTYYVEKVNEHKRNSSAAAT